ncbi:MAG: polyprenyl synthetase family protein [Lachnospiraceae bacterium]|jgi:geranylgeranyl diphosphate synthase type II|nr:polyprenyl synthetase family protein [Lachnospiraceae bacterium]
MREKKVDFKKVLAERIQEIQEVINGYLPQETGYQKRIMEAMNYSMNAGGKRIRPLLMMETCRLLGGDIQEAKPFMAAMEMIHTSSLIHDDLPCMDNDPYRRGKQSTWAKFGEDFGVLAGDALIVEAFGAAAKAFETTKFPDRVGKAMGILAQKTGIYGMIGGQVVDVQLTDQPISREEMDFIYRLKTGALLEASMMIGAVLAGADEERLTLVSRIALNVGIAFQIQDDILDVTSSQEVLGKPIGSDEKNCKTTYVSLEGLPKAIEEVKRLSDEAILLLRSIESEHEFLEQLIVMLITREK